MIGTLYNCGIFDGPRAVIVVATHSIDSSIPTGTVRVALLSPDASGISAVPELVTVSPTPPVDDATTFVPAWPWAAP